MNNNKLIEVSGCDNCPGCSYTDRAGFECIFSKMDELGQIESIEENGFAEPITPTWCPLKKSSLTISIKQ